MNKYNRGSKFNRVVRVVCLVLAGMMILSAFASGMLLFF